MAGARRGRRSGSAAVEFALVGPLLILMLVAIVVYGGWFWLAQSVQSLAAEAARAALGGLDGAEQEALAVAFVAEEAETLVGLEPDRTRVVVDAGEEAIRVRVIYDARSHPLMVLAGLVPPPPLTIERSAVVRVGGYG